MNPAKRPYVASSKAIDNASGKSGGIKKIKERIIGAKNPTIQPYFHPHIYEHRRTGMCIGKSIEPIPGIWPVKKGRTMHKEKK